MTATAFWNRGVDAVPSTTGALHVMAGEDVYALEGLLPFALPFGSVLDVGCGSGRLAQFCRTYRGVDLAQDAVDYCRRLGLDVSLTVTPSDLPRGPFELVTALSVFTHISHQARADYLRAFHRRAPAVLVDILPGPLGGGIEAWYTPREAFEAMAFDEGWRVTAATDLQQPGYLHRYYWLEAR